MKTGLVSVVLPIYNVEKYIDRCINSIVKQTYRNLEIILVDDGSPDSCPEKCEEWARRDERIKVIHKSNEGLGYARNTGIDNASGEYICFFDSDDYVAPDTIGKSMEAAKRNHSDMVLFGHFDVNSDGRIVKTFIPNAEKQNYIGSEVQEKLLPDLISNNPRTGASKNLWLCAWSCLYSVRLLVDNNWSFVSERDIISEDVYSLLRLYKYVRRVTIVSEAFYYYCENRASLTHTYKSDRFNRIKHLYNVCMDACDELGYNSDVRDRIAIPFISNTIAAMKMIVTASLDKSEKKRLLREIIDDELLIKVLNNLSLRSEKPSRRVFLALVKAHSYAGCYLLLSIKERKHMGYRCEQKK